MLPGWLLQLSLSQSQYKQNELWTQRNASEDVLIPQWIDKSLVPGGGVEPP